MLFSVLMSIGRGGLSSTGWVWRGLGYLHLALLGGLGKLFDDGNKVLHVVFKMLEKNSQQAFPLL